jgi:hypothetical protein
MRPAGGSSAKKSGAQREPSLRFYHSDALRAKTLVVVETLETAADPTEHRDALVELVLELTESGLNYYFVKPLKVARVGFVAEQSARLGLTTFLRLMGPVSRSVIAGMDAAQLLAVTAHIRDLME